MKNRVDINFEIQFKTPFHSGTGLSSGLIDRGVKRDSEGLLYIPATTFKGILRNKVEDIINILNLTEKMDIENLPPNDYNEYNNLNLLRYFHANHKPTPVERIFGSVVKPGNLFVENLKMVKEDSDFFHTDNSKEYDRFLQTESRTQTRVYRSSQTVKQGALFQSEYGLKDLRFKGRIYGFINGITSDFIENSQFKSISYEVFFLLMGLKLIDRIAGNKSIGMGQFEYTDIMLTVDNKAVDKIEDLFHDDFFEALQMYQDEMEDNETI